jgi:diphthamide biosynthesis enzyme Dph1/Dph2-like protein
MGIAASVLSALIWMKEREREREEILTATTVPIDTTHGIGVLYVFVDIRFDFDHFLETVKYNFAPTARLALVSTIQFAASLQAAKSFLAPHFAEVTIPQEKPLSPGEVHTQRERERE